jgi:hypothetical protein
MSRLTSLSPAIRAAVRLGGAVVLLQERAVERAGSSRSDRLPELRRSV